MSGCVSWATSHKEPLMRKIQTCLKYVQRIEHTGSSYENLKVKQNSLEWDVLFIFRHGDRLKVTELDVPGYVTVSPKDGQGHLFHYKTWATSGDICSVSMREKFHWDVKMALNYLNEAGELNREVGLCYDGQASKMMVMTTKGRTWYTLDLIPAYEVDGNLYVSKPLPGAVHGTVTPTWCQSTALKEKEVIVRLDEADDGCRCMVTRNVKLICSKDAFLEPLPSYLVKTTLLYLCDNKDLSWDEHQWLPRLQDMMRYLAESLDSGMLPHYFLKNLNLLSQFDSMSLRTWATRLLQLVEEEEALQEMLPEKEQEQLSKLNKATSAPTVSGC